MAPVLRQLMRYTPWPGTQHPELAGSNRHQVPPMIQRYAALWGVYGRATINLVKVRSARSLLQDWMSTHARADAQTWRDDSDWR